MGLHNPYRTRKVHGLCKPNWNRRAYLKGPLSSYLNKEVEKENPKPRKHHKSSCFVSCTLLGSVTKQIL